MTSDELVDLEEEESVDTKEQSPPRPATLPQTASTEDLSAKKKPPSRIAGSGLRAPTAGKSRFILFVFLKQRFCTFQLYFYYYKCEDYSETIAKMLQGQGHCEKRYVTNLQLTLYNKQPIGYTQHDHARSSKDPYWRIEAYTTAKVSDTLNHRLCAAVHQNVTIFDLVRAFDHILLP